MDYIDREALLKDIEGTVLFSVRKGAVPGEARGARKVINRIMAARKAASPCNLCRYNPPSSMGGKPCSVCPASAAEGDV